MDFVDVVKNKQRLIKTKDVLTRVQRSKAWLYKQLKAGTFPKPVRIGSRSISFVESEVNYWIEERISASRDNIKTRVS
ncbi:AlpA family phage regulatory protein [Salmonella enterica subsp. enterica serovar Abony]|nr:AlpA family phage regulatory protein [Salmonella enterica subsp. enterica serovar Abony]EBY6397197.1 AlpA family phage regulatory protein [Salmonella enterica subsp. enterica serovar Abony]